MTTAFNFAALTSPTTASTQFSDDWAHAVPVLVKNHDQAVLLKPDVWLTPSGKIFTKDGFLSSQILNRYVYFTLPDGELISAQKALAVTFLATGSTYAERSSWLKELGLVANHINSNRLDNRLDNINLTTLSGNRRLSKKVKRQQRLVLAIHAGGTEFLFASVMDAQRALEVDHRRIADCLSLHYSSTAGFTFTSVDVPRGILKEITSHIRQGTPLNTETARVFESAKAEARFHVCEKFAFEAPLARSVAI